MTLDWDGKKGSGFEQFVDKTIKTAGLTYPEGKEFYTFIVNGNLHVKGSIINKASGSGALLLVVGTLKAKSIVAGGSEIVICGHAEISNAVYGHYNDGSLRFRGGVTVPLIFSDDHHVDYSGSSRVEFYSFNDKWEGSQVSGDERRVEYPLEDEEGERTLLVPSALAARLNPEIRSLKKFKEWLLDGRSVFRP